MFNLEAFVIVFVLVAVPVSIVLYWVLRARHVARRRAALRAHPVSAELVDTLRRNVRIYASLPADVRDELHGHINVFLDEKRFFGCDGLKITNEMCFTIAGTACLLLLNRETAYFPGFTSVLVYPDAYVAKEVNYDGDIEIHEQVERAGESWEGGPVILSWIDVLDSTRDDADGYNVVLHEFAHKLDEENDGTNGLPVLDDPEHYRSWGEVLAREYQALAERVHHGTNHVIDEYGLTAPEEFFAVATESFFEKPVAMRKTLPDLYAQLRNAYRVDPAQWVDAALS